MSLLEALTESSPPRGEPAVVSLPAAEADPERASASVAVADDTVGLYVATDLDCWVTYDARWYALDVVDDGRCYRRLDPEYYAWLYHRMLAAGLARKAGGLPAATYHELCGRFNAIHAWAMARPEQRLFLEAVGVMDTSGYQPPPLSASWE